MTTAVSTRQSCFTGSELGIVVADLSVLAGEALQSRNTETITDVDYRGEEGYVSVGLGRQRQILDGFGRNRLVHFVFDRAGIGTSLECRKDTHGFDKNSDPPTRQRLSTNASGRLIQVTEQQVGEETDKYEPVGERGANIRTILAMAKQTSKQAKVSKNHDKTENPVQGKSYGAKTVTFSQTGIVPVVGKLLVVAGNAVRNLPQHAHVEVDTYVDCGTIRGLYVDNVIDLWGANSRMQTDACLNVNMHPFPGGSARIAFTSIELSMGKRGDDGFTSTQDKLVQYGDELVRIRRQKVRGTESGEPQRFPATVDTIISMANYVTRVAHGETDTFK